MSVVVMDCQKHTTQWHVAAGMFSDGHPDDGGNPIQRAEHDLHLPGEQFMGMLSTVKHELKEVGLVTLYFFFCFGVILTLKKLMLEGYHIEFYAFSTALVGALIVAKVVGLLGKTRAGTRFDARYSLGMATLYRTIVFSGCTFLVLFAEKMFHAFRESDLLGAAFMDVWAHKDLSLIFAKVMCIGLAFMGFFLYRGIDRRLGEGTLRRMVFDPPN
ncbi:MAG TPA: hypothetical protein VLA60_06315 [Nitrospirales bacterium]|nr:hypothetical protein [Nitrospirales bacterium]